MSARAICDPHHFQVLEAVTYSKHFLDGHRLENPQKTPTLAHLRRIMPRVEFQENHECAGVTICG
jgi:hypothetical protein